MLPSMEDQDHTDHVTMLTHEGLHCAMPHALTC